MADKTDEKPVCLADILQEADDYVLKIKDKEEASRNEST
ncbi:Uncharacterised protein [Candidatus Tiddalikarchaeum anstoanum]|nr:Uncharacterised protein [Candidatus Tiddalikarchaeum anstoanum]